MADLDKIYQEYLGRDVDSSGAATYAGWSEDDVINALKSSEEYQTKEATESIASGRTLYQDWRNEGNDLNLEFSASSKGDYVVVDPNQKMAGEYELVGYDTDGSAIYRDGGTGEGFGGITGWIDDVLGLDEGESLGIFKTISTMGLSHVFDEIDTAVDVTVAPALARMIGGTEYVAQTADAWESTFGINADDYLKYAGGVEKTIGAIAGGVIGGIWNFGLGAGIGAMIGGALGGASAAASDYIGRGRIEEWNDMAVRVAAGAASGAIGGASSAGMMTATQAAISTGAVTAGAEWGTGAEMKDALAQGAIAGAGSYLGSKASEYIERTSAYEAAMSNTEKTGSSWHNEAAYDSNGIKYNWDRMTSGQYARDLEIQQIIQSYTPAPGSSTPVVNTSTVAPPTTTAPVVSNVDIPAPSSGGGAVGGGTPAPNTGFQLGLNDWGDVLDVVQVGTGVGALAMSYMAMKEGDMSPEEEGEAAAREKIAYTEAINAWYDSQTVASSGGDGGGLTASYNTYGGS